MSDLTFATPSQSPSMGIQDPKPKKGVLTKVLVVVLVVAILGEVGYFFYNRYVSTGGGLPFKNLSTSGTMDYTPDQSPVPDDQAPVVSQGTFSTVADASRDKANETIDAIFDKYPKGFLVSAEIRTTLEGKLVNIDKNQVVTDEAIYTDRLNLVNSRGEPMVIRFTETEVERMRVVLLEKGVLGKEMKYSEIAPGDMLHIISSFDLFDLRRGADDITIQILKF